MGRTGRRIEEGQRGMLSPKRIYSRKRKDCSLGIHVAKTEEEACRGDEEGKGRTVTTIELCSDQRVLPVGLLQ